MQYRVIKFILLILLFSSCIDQNSNKNVGVLSKVPDFYRNGQKKRAYEFLISNMDGLRHIKKTGGIIDDIEGLSAEYLIENIEAAYSSSKSLREANLISEKEFHEYILPYRINSSRIEYWRKNVWKKYNLRGFQNIKDERSLIDSCNKINEELRDWFMYGHINQIEDTLTYSDIDSYKKGSCVSMANLAAYSFRALGIPVAIDFVPAWGNLPGGHTWNSLVLKNNRSYPFQGAESNILSFEPLYLVKDENNDETSTYRKPAKIYRSTYSIQKESVFYKYKDLPRMSLSSRMLDVTKEYIPVTDVSINTKKLTIPSELLFINVFNMGIWTSVMATERVNNEYIFREMGRDLLYSISAYRNAKFQLVDFVFYLNNNGQVHRIKPDNRKKIDIKLSRIRSKELDQMEELKNGWDIRKLLPIAKGRAFTKPMKNKSYKLYCWQNKWVQIGSVKEKDGYLHFKEIPSNALYLVCQGSRENKDRPFIVLDNAVKWL